MQTLAILVLIVNFNGAEFRSDIVLPGTRGATCDSIARNIAMNLRANGLRGSAQCFEVAPPVVEVRA